MSELLAQNFVLNKDGAEISQNSQKEIKIKCIGGGRIDHSSEKENMLIWGYSNKFGRANHQNLLDNLLNKHFNYAKKSCVVQNDESLY